MDVNIYDGYIAKFGEHFEAALNAANKGNIQFELHKEHYRNSNTPIDITLRFLPGQIQQDVVQYPIQVMVECDDVLEDLVRDCLSSIATNYNTKILAIDGFNFREFYNMPMLTGKFKKEGIYSRSEFSMDATLFTFNSVLDIKKITLSTGDVTIDGTTYVFSEEINYLNFAMSYVASTNSTGALSTSKVGNVVDSVMTNYSMTFVPIQSTPASGNIAAKNKISSFIKTVILKKTNAEATINLKIELEDTLFSSQVTIPCIIQSAAYSKEYGGWPIVQLALLEK